jgi:hypothetical protein
MDKELREKVYRMVINRGAVLTVIDQVDAILALFASSLGKAQREAFESGYILALTAHTEAGEWRGPWKCPKCEAELNYEPRGHYKAHITGRGAIPCDGVMVPYERRKGGA